MNDYLKLQIKNPNTDKSLWFDYPFNVVPYIISNANTIAHTLSTLTTADILNILNMILVSTLAFAVLSIILFKLLH